MGWTKLLCKSKNWLYSDSLRYQADSANNRHISIFIWSQKIGTRDLNLSQWEFRIEYFDWCNSQHYANQLKIQLVPTSSLTAAGSSEGYVTFEILYKLHFGIRNRKSKSRNHKWNHEITTEIMKSQLKSWNHNWNHEITLEIMKSQMKSSTSNHSLPYRIDFPSWHYRSGAQSQISF